MRRILKPPALKKGDTIRIIAPSSPVEKDPLERGIKEIERLGYAPQWNARVLSRQDYFAGPATERVAELAGALAEPSSSAIFCVRGGYGVNYLLGPSLPGFPETPKILLGYSDLTLLQIFLWQKFGWVTFYGPMAASGFAAGAGKPGGYDLQSFLHAVSETRMGWLIELDGEPLREGEGQGILMGGCLTLVECSLGTPWELDTRGAILFLEDRGMKPYHVDRALMHLLQAGKFNAVKGIVLGEFPECDPPATGGPAVRDICRRILEPLNVPIVWGVAAGHTPRPMKTLPLGVAARLTALGGGTLEVLDAACLAPEPVYEFSE